MATVHSSHTGVTGVPRPPQKLASWKCIASYFAVDERTAKRWERERRLPVHRAPGGKRSAVFAYSWELDSWMDNVEPDEELHPGANEATKAEYRPVAVVASLDETDDASESPMGEPAAPAVARRLGRWKVLALAAPAVVVLVAVAFWAKIGLGGPGLSMPTVQATAARVKHVPATGAEDLYLRGHYFWSLRTADGLANALDAYMQAVVLDPSYAEAYAGLAETYDLLPQFGRADLGDALRKAEAAADRAIALNPNLADAHAAKAFALFYWDWDIAGSDAEFQRALALDPDSVLTHQWYASTLDCRDDGSEALRQIEAARRLNPASAAIAADSALFQAEFGNYAAGVKGLKDIEQTQPTLATPAWFLMELSFATGDLPAYVAEARRYASITRAPEDAALADAVARGWARGGKIGLLRALLQFRMAAFDRGATANYSSDTGYRIGEILLLLDRPKEALPWFREALNKHNIGLLDMEDCPWAKPLQRDPGYATLFADIRRQERGAPAHPTLVRVALRLPQ
jgi:tetratricopeptide (TPR) repeat protein